MTPRPHAWSMHLRRRFTKSLHGCHVLDNRIGPPQAGQGNASLTERFIDIGATRLAALALDRRFRPDLIVITPAIRNPTSYFPSPCGPSGRVCRTMRSNSCITWL
jgi:hypothetical protein